MAVSDNMVAPSQVRGRPGRASGAPEHSAASRRLRCVARTTQQRCAPERPC